MTQRKEKEFNILGLKVKLGDNSSSDSDHSTSSKILPDDIVGLVDMKASEIRKKAPRLKDSDLSVLVALELAKELLEDKANYKGQVGELREIANAAIEDLKLAAPLEQ